MLTTKEAADRLGIKARSVVRLINESKVLKARKATTEEIAQLLTEGRVSSVTHSGILVIEEAEMARYEKERRAAHRPKKAHPDTSE